MPVRNPHAAGTFYPAEPKEVRAFCQKHFPKPAEVHRAKAVIVPHAGWAYSGKTACQVLNQVEIPDRVIMMGPNHYAVGDPFALYPTGGWKTPLGDAPIDQTLAEQITKHSEIIAADTFPHMREHSLEVLVPFLQYKNPKVRIVPLLVGSLDAENCQLAAEGLVDVIKEGSPRPLLLVSTDMSHYESDDATRKKDRYALDAIEHLDKRALEEAIKRYQISMCGFGPVYMLLHLAKRLGITKATLVDYSTSADATGDKDRVVGYAGFILE